MEAEVKEDKVIVEEGEELYEQGWYGNLEGKKLILDLVEAVLLMERAKIELKDMDFKEFFHYCSKIDPRFTARYAVYRDLRDRGLPVRTGFKGSDFRVYERGAKPKKQGKVKWIVFAEAEDYPCEMEKLGKAIKLGKNIRAVALWAIVDNDLDVTYYIINSISP
ncbi:MAG: tRNA-intron lyase [Candidatus Aenigmatarchaeota archaeon]